MGNARTKLIAVVTASACLLAAGCKRYTAMDRAVIANRRGDKHLDEVNGLYRIGPPDRIKIHVRDNPDLSTETAVRPDGYITFPFSELHDVYVEGLTPIQLSKKLETDLSKYIRPENLDVTVEVTAFLSRKIYVFGEVGAQGAQPFTGEVTVLDALASARAHTRRSAERRILLVRGDPVNPEIFKINIKKIIEDADTAQNLLLRQDDVLYVPPNIFARVGYAIDNVLWPFRSVLGAMYTADLATGNR